MNAWRLLLLLNVAVILALMPMVSNVSLGDAVCMSGEPFDFTLVRLAYQDWGLASPHIASAEEPCDLLLEVKTELGSVGNSYLLGLGGHQHILLSLKSGRPLTRLELLVVLEHEMGHALAGIDHNMGRNIMYPHIDEHLQVTPSQRKEMYHQHGKERKQ